MLFGGWSPYAVDAMAAGVRWVQMAGTGVDGVSPEVKAAPVLTAAHGASAVAISEYVIATMAAFARNFPHNWLREAPAILELPTSQHTGGGNTGSLRFRRDRATRSPHRCGHGDERCRSSAKFSAQPDRWCRDGPVSL